METSLRPSLGCCSAPAMACSDPTCSLPSSPTHCCDLTGAYSVEDLLANDPFFASFVCPQAQVVRGTARPEILTCCSNEACLEEEGSAIEGEEPMASSSALREIGWLADESGMPGYEEGKQGKGKGKEAEGDDCECCEAGCPAEDVVVPEDNCPDCLPDGTPNTVSTFGGELGTPAGSVQMSEVGELPWDQKAIEELLRCCCCEESTSAMVLPSHHQSQHPNHLVHFPATAPVIPTPRLFTCQWRDCTAGFETRDSLVDHVNAAHLMNPPPMARTSVSIAAATPASSDMSSTSWLDPSTAAFEGLFAGPGFSNFGATWPTSAPSTTSTFPTPNFQFKQPLPPTETSPSLSPSPVLQSSHSHIRSPTTSTIGNDDSPSTPSTHVCRWQSCSAEFTSTAHLTAHLSTAHVGSGHSRYICLWTGCCTDSGEKREFSQRQKVMRHLQSHTGDRPFKCDVCGRAFGEAATLTQHLRTHTNEKPYACTHPGCTKSFALQSALTIHLRIHANHRPFVCPHPECDAAFAESSNLSKHIRVHSGEKPFACQVEGCGKRFARSDQLGRHGKVHEKDDDEGGPRKRSKKT